MNFSRKMIVIVGAALLAACGDKVTVAGPTTLTPTPATPAPSKINSVDVAPATATLTIGQTLSFTAAVNADAGVTATIAWSSSDAAKATVGATGVVTAVAATPGVAVCAEATSGTQKVKGCATVVVQAATALIPATVSIQSVTKGGLNTPVDPTAVVGQMDVTLNVNPGNQTIKTVDLLVDGAVAATQTFTAAQSAALRFAADEAVAAQTTFPQIVFSVNTAAFNALTGAATWSNGARPVSARVYTSAGGTATPAATATASQSLTFANVNTFSTTVTVGGTTATALNGSGYSFSKGDVAVSIIPVSYTGTKLASATVNFGTAACDNNGTAQRAKALTAPTTGSSWTASWVNSGTAGATNLAKYEFNGTVCAGALSTGEFVSVAAAQDSVGNPYTTTALPVNVGSGIRIDNRAPNAAAVFGAGNTVANPNGRALSWLNDAAKFTTVTAAGNNGMIAAAVLDGAAGVGGVGTVTYAAKVGADLTAAKAAADITDPTSLAASATNADYCLLQYAQDKLGNRTGNPAACLQTFGVDRAAPTIAYAAGISANTRFAAAPALEFNVTVSDTGLVGNSGMAPAAAVTGTVMFRGNGNTAAQTCFVGTWVSPDCSAATLAGAAPSFGTTTMALTAGNTVSTEGYYTFTATAYDAAGNAAALAARTTLVDASNPTVGAASGPLSVATGYTFPVSALVNEALDIQSYWFNATYGAGVGPFAGPATMPQGTVSAVNGYNAATFINTNYQVNSTFNLPVAIQANMGAGLTAVSAITASATNQANAIITGASAAIPAFGTAATAMALTSWTAFTAAALPAGKTGISSALSTAAVTAKPASSTLSVTTTGATAVFNNPFTRVDFYGLNVGATAWVFLGSTTASALTDDGAVRTFTYSIPVSGATVFAALGGTAATITQNVIAFGYKADGSVAMVNAAALALNIVY